MARHAKYVEDVATAMSIRFNGYGNALKAAGEDVTICSFGEAYFDIPLQPFDTLPFPSLYHYSDSRGLPGLRKKLAAYYDGQYGVPVDAASEIIVTAGSKLGVHMSFMTLLEPGDEVVVPEPAWVSYSEQARLCHANPVMVPLDVPVTELGNWVTPRTRAIVICSPQNPTGRVYTREELKYLHEVARERGIYLISDEAYSDFVSTEPFVSAGLDDPEKEHTIICNTMSKGWGLSGWRIGYLISNAKVMEQLLKISQHLMTCPATILEQYLERHFYDILEVTKPQIRDVVAKRAELALYMDEIGLRHMDGSATFYFFVSLDGSTLGSEAFCMRLLSESRVVAVPGVGYGKSCDGHIRVGIGTESMDRMRAALRAIKALIDATQDPERAAEPASLAASAA
ncbi:pyridoxal phosphate-dependent aminotransferase [Longimicrobium terrae]|uniref:Aspartate aminotransferase/aminotransferase n=1 Tax=Longimicrobium terrae TaxID=1639882 RepID=A0A841GWY7_9BACT|nr:pyridoxal phosphate-dependent aminotransferase [Longimicrobium terrae]MBB4636048.1 aspartate aminotransferase/aminotransferase [Longimicrobium terrae]MBB6070443.1 aspartate aminotransferase/aminotransferase [Longimicrobium terrae]NNC30935.1 pyridoxal phosphate-dependent aminotransferase [Longimicrobium terrae]